MKFGPVSVAEAEGAILAHSLTLAGQRLRKGLVLTPAHLQALSAEGVSQVTVARLSPGDVDENAAAARVADSISGDGLRVGNAGTGRVNIFAEANGIAEVNAAAIDALNAVDAMITVATVPRWQRMARGGMVATVKIISYAVPETALDRACAAGRGALVLRESRYRVASLIQTSIGSADDGAKGHKAIEARLAALDMGLSPLRLVPHATEPLEQALREAPGEVLFILTGSATSDWHDVAPEALRAAGGELIHFGMPVDPGNLLFLGELHGKPVIGLPGCARSPALNGADWVLERVLCGVDVTRHDIMGMGVGGLLKEIPQRPQPRREIE